MVNVPVNLKGKRSGTRALNGAYAYAYANVTYTRIEIQFPASRWIKYIRLNWRWRDDELRSLVHKSKSKTFDRTLSPTPKSNYHAEWWWAPTHYPYPSPTLSSLWCAVHIMCVRVCFSFDSFRKLIKSIYKYIEMIFVWKFHLSNDDGCCIIIMPLFDWCAKAFALSMGQMTKAKFPIDSISLVCQRFSHVYSSKMDYIWQN